MPVDHPLATRSEVTLTELMGDTWIGGDLQHAASSRLLIAACEAAGFRPRFTVQAQDHYTAIAFVKAGVGISVMPQLAAQAVQPDEPVRILQLGAPQPRRHIAAVVREPAGGGAASRAVELLLELIG